MKLFKSLKYDEIQSLIDKTVRFTSDCPILGGFDTVVIVNNYYIRDNLGTVLEGLKDRRKKEIEIFLNGNYSYKPITNLSGGYVTDNDGNGFIPDGLGGEL